MWKGIYAAPGLRRVRVGAGPEHANQLNAGALEQAIAAHRWWDCFLAGQGSTSQSSLAPKCVRDFLQTQPFQSFPSGPAGVNPPAF